MISIINYRDLTANGVHLVHLHEAATNHFDSNSSKTIGV